MLSHIRSLGFQGVGGYAVDVECYVTNGMPGFEIVGLPDTAVKEARERVRAAIRNNGMKFPVSRLTVNLAPADQRKAGTLYDLPVLLGILSATGEIRRLPDTSAFLGELSLAGEVRPVPGVLPMALAAVRCGVKELYVPAENAPEAAFVEELTVYPVDTVSRLMAHLRGDRPIEPATAPEGKSMLAKRLPSILPAMSRAEMMESTEIHSVAGLTDHEHPIVSQRPFRAPHHTVSPVALSGGGATLRPGEMSLAHNGVLFLDELPEYPSNVLETMRQPLEDGVITISRAVGSVTYPSRFMLVCAMNPCKCGWFGHPSGRCRCTPNEVRRYHNRVSGPLLDRMDLIVEVPSLDYEELTERPAGEPSAAIRARVDAARAVQRERFGPDGPEQNAHMGPKELAAYCQLSPTCETLMRQAFDAMGLTARSYDRILRMARTIADLDGAKDIRPQHLAEAIQYRTFDLNEGLE